ncbi:barstar family protein [Zobellella maritima]|uniref:barstar family protein n=1 Tax=Zobellella maritima TaxID=2059725 RepID=UPI0013004026|nr:barstar family protein [Zobellella maritima]
MKKSQLLQTLAAGPARTCCLDSTDFQALQQAATELGLAFWAVDFSGVTDKAGCVDTLTNSLGVPGWFSQNWDAVHDGFIELLETDQQGGLLCLQNVETFANHDHPSWLRLLDLLADATEYWREQDLPFWCVVLSSSPESLSVAELENH